MDGSWGCFDDLNRVDVQVLSVAAQLFANILLAKKGQKRLLDLTAESANTAVSPECGIFCTQARFTLSCCLCCPEIRSKLRAFSAVQA